jgi:hypothetical protein
VPEQPVRMACAALRVPQRPGLEGVGKWVHMLGFRGHFVTRSRGYSTTLGTLSNDRAQWRADHDHRRRARGREHPRAGGLGVPLAAGVEASIRVGREALLDLRRGPPDDTCPGLPQETLPRSVYLDACAPSPRSARAACATPS